MGILDDPRRGCQVHAFRHGTHVRTGPHAKRPPVVSTTRSKQPPVCESCESCVRYEAWLKNVVESEASKAFLVRRKRGSRFTNKDAVFAIGGIVHRARSRSSIMIDEAPSITVSPCALTPEESFGILAPPIPFKKKWPNIVRSSAAKLYFVLTHCKRILDERMKEEIETESKWYLTSKEFEKLLFTAGLDWMERPQIFKTYSELDVNKSGYLHVSELCSALESAEELCKDILYGLCDLEELQRDLLEIKNRPNSFEVTNGLLNFLS